MQTIAHCLQRPHLPTERSEMAGQTFNFKGCEAGSIIAARSSRILRCRLLPPIAHRLAINTALQAKPYLENNRAPSPSSSSSKLLRNCQLSVDPPGLDKVKLPRVCSLTNPCFFADDLLALWHDGCRKGTFLVLWPVCCRERAISCGVMRSAADLRFRPSL